MSDTKTTQNGATIETLPRPEATLNADEAGEAQGGSLNPYRAGETGIALGAASLQKCAPADLGLSAESLMKW